MGNSERSKGTQIEIAFPKENIIEILLKDILKKSMNSFP